MKVSLDLRFYKFKTEGNPYEPLSDDARQALQAQVNDYYDLRSPKPSRAAARSIPRM